MKTTKTGEKALRSSFITRHLAEIIILLVFILVALYIAFSPANSLVNWYDNDDGFFYFKAAQNIVAGKGVTFDGINPTNGFHPLWMLICIPIFAIAGKDLILPLRMIVIVFGLMQAISLVLLYRLFARKLSRMLSFMVVMAFGLAWMVFRDVFTGGLESALSFLLVVILLGSGIQFRHSDKRTLKNLLVVGIIAGLTVLSRLDNLIFVAIFGVWLVFDRVEDSNLIFVDAVAAILIVTTSAVAASNYGVYPLENAILIITALLAVFGVVAFFLMGFYSASPFELPQSKASRGFIAGGISAVVMIGIYYLLFHPVLTEPTPPYLLLYSGFGWLFYAAVIRGFAISRVFPISTHVVQDKDARISIVLGWIKKIAAYFLPVVVLTGLYMIWSQVNFGTAIPVSGQIKVWWGTLSNSIYGSPIDTLDEIRAFLFESRSPFDFLYSLFAPILAKIGISGYIPGLISWGLIGASCILLIIVGQKRSLFQWTGYLAILPLAAASIFRMLYFYISGYVHMRSWYWTIETLFIFLLIAAIAASAWEYRQRTRSVRIVIGAAAGLIMLVTAFIFVRNLRINYPWTVDPETTPNYLIIPRMIEAETEPGSIIGTPGGGSLSYFIKDRVIVNLDGLMNSKAYFDALRKFDTHEIMKANRRSIRICGQVHDTGKFPLLDHL